MSRSATQLPTDTWVTATWDDYLRVLEALLMKKPGPSTTTVGCGLKGLLLEMTTRGITRSLFMRFIYSQE